MAVTEAALTVLFFFIRKRTRSLEKLQILSYQKCDSYSSYSSCVSFLLNKNKTINLEKLDIRVKRVYLLMYIFNRFIFRKCQSVFWVPFPNTKMILASITMISAKTGLKYKPIAIPSRCWYILPSNVKGTFFAQSKISYFICLHLMSVHILNYTDKYIIKIYNL